jgi:hypothetical protein
MRNTMSKSKTPGEELVSKILADLKDNGLQPDSRESELLERARGMRDRIAELESLVTVHGMTITDRMGNVRPSPLLSEIRQSTIV